MNQYSLIKDYFNYLRDELNISICVKDYSGFIPINKDLHNALNEFTSHVHDYCIYLKQDRDCYFKCLSMMPKILKKALSNKQTYKGTCHGGLTEYIVPIINKENVIGVISIGSFIEKETDKNKIFQSLTENFPTLNINTLKEKYNNIAIIDEAYITQIIKAVEIIAFLLAKEYQELDMTNNTNLLENTRLKRNDDTILVSKICEHIKENINTKIKLEQISEIVNYSHSYISRTFNKQMGMNINTYINKTRIEISKNYLLKSEKSITEVARMVGFDDPAYFSKVFSNLIDITPQEFRRRFSEEQ